MIALVGYTGFVGSNIYKNSNGEIEKVYNQYDNHLETLTHVSNESKILISFCSTPIYVNVSTPAEKVESEISSKLSRRISKRHLPGHVGKPST